MRKVLNNKVLLVTVAILLFANIGMLFFFLSKREPERKNFREDRQKSPITDFLKNDIGFTPQQMAAFESTRQQHRQKLKPLFEDIRIVKVQFYELLTNQEINDSVISNAATIIGQKQKLLDLQTFNNFREIRKLCTAEQRPKYDSLIVNEISTMWFPAWKGRNHQEKKIPKAHH